MFYLLESNINTIIFSNLGKNIQKDGRPTGRNNLKNLVLLQVKLENVTSVCLSACLYLYLSNRGTDIFYVFLSLRAVLNSTAQLRGPHFGQRAFLRFGVALPENLLNWGLWNPIAGSK